LGHEFRGDSTGWIDTSLEAPKRPQRRQAPCKAIVIGENNGLVTLELTSNVLYDLTTGKDVEITLTNTVASYTS